MCAENRSRRLRTASVLSALEDVPSLSPRAGLTVSQERLTGGSCGIACPPRFRRKECSPSATHHSPKRGIDMGFMYQNALAAMVRAVTQATEVDAYFSERMLRQADVIWAVWEDDDETLHAR